jgi:hypothetical protein
VGTGEGNSDNVVFKPELVAAMRHDMPEFFLRCARIVPGLIFGMARKLARQAFTLSDPTQ